MKDVAVATALFLAGMGTSTLLPWQAPDSYELGEEVSIITITVPEANVQAHFACQRLNQSN